MSILRNFTFGILVIGIFCVPTLAKAATQDEAYRQLLLQLLNTLEQRLEMLLQQQAMMLEAETTDSNYSGELLDSVDVIAVYSLQSSGSVNMISNSSHRKYFKEVLDIFPVEYAAEVKQLVVFEGESSEFDAFVETLPPYHDTWSYAVNEDVLVDVGTVSNLELTVHELAHIVSYEPVLGLVQPATIHCHDYFKARGCLSGNSYLNAYVDEFWSSSDLYRAIDFSEGGYLNDEATKYYEEHPGEYVSDYAAVNPEEDFAESFMFFMLDYEPTGSVANKKVNFFSTFSEMREIKVDINS